MSATYTLIIQFTGPKGITEDDIDVAVYDVIREAGGDIREFILEDDE